MAVTGLTGAAAATAPVGLDSYYGQPLAWAACGNGYECGKLSVPLDYARPSGKQIKLSMVRLPATGKKVGSIVLNFGGPGGSGVDTLKASRDAVSADIRERFDVVSFDPRGVGGSAPVRCFDTLDLDAYFAIDPTPDTKVEVKKAENWDKVFANYCAKNSGTELLAHVGTVDSARDMDVMRAALGEARLTYLGFSYGTYLGSVYADLFPKRIRAMVLDGAEDPSENAQDLAADQDRAFEVATESFMKDCFERAGCPFREHTIEGAQEQLDELYTRADKSPLRNEYDGRQVTEAVVSAAVDYSMYDPRSWPRLRKALAEAYDGDGTELLLLADESNGRRPDGRYDNSFEALMAINCVDHPENPCPHWPVKGTRYPKKVQAKGSPPIVVVGTTRDPATPYKLAQSLAGQLAHGVLLTNDADGHTGYRRGSACLDRKVDQYLITAKAPQAGTCRDPHPEA
ncbi:alpha/beta hydrolase [Nonomuraea gerenzanensis]|uniref:Probable exported protease n=1 Tax=Nonomuraea gerenzanensis TaxID=93944 RepID=A0A1M4E8L3_9ACTN|nr:alpha/beta hydrolase [Nonomuraea gerenzanensis]UBU17472.1 alpha/beta hydrolase [Nonomuraea gerenzanensis]SBO95227.1 probable exported protease [Nonomuraea gerenzanensis]